MNDNKIQIELIRFCINDLSRVVGRRCSIMFGINSLEKKWYNNLKILYKNGELLGTVIRAYAGQDSIGGIITTDEIIGYKIESVSILARIRLSMYDKNIMFLKKIIVQWLNPIALLALLVSIYSYNMVNNTQKLKIKEGNPQSLMKNLYWI